MPTKKALVTGGAGFIGSHLCERLLSEGYFVYCVDNLYSGNQDNIKHLQGLNNFVFIVADVTTLFELEVNEIYNLASPASPLHYQSNPMYTVLTSINGTFRMGSLAQKLRAKMFQASTSEVYGDPLVHPQPENYFGNVNPISTRACYDEGKRLAESILFILYRQISFPLKVGRIFNTYGPRMDIDDGRVISNFINRALRNENLSVYGDGSQTRSFSYVSDLIDGIRKLMNTDDSFTGPINLGSQFEYTMLDVAKCVIELTESKSEIVFTPLPDADPTKRRPNGELAKRVLGWEPQVTLREGLTKTIEYYKNLKEKQQN